MSTIYLSSTWEDLKEHREAAGRAVRRLNHQVIGMEDYVAADERPLDRCLQDVARCDLYVGLFAHRYGYIPHDGNPGKLSITELEYREAVRLQKPRLIFVLDLKAPWLPESMDSHTGEGDRGARIAALREELIQGRLASPFTSPEQLEGVVSAAVANQTRSADVAVSARKPLPPEPRQIVFDVYLTYGGNDSQLARSLALNLNPEPDRCVVLPGPRGLFSRTLEDFVQLEADVTRCAVAAVLLTETTLNRMEEARAGTELVLDTMRARTGSLAALAVSPACAVRADEWAFDQVFDVSGYEADTAGVARRLKTFLKAFGNVQTPPAIGVPWTVAAMDMQEARALRDDPAMISRNMGDSMRLRFAQVVAALAADFTERYAARREHWRPPGTNATIAEVSADCIGGLARSQNPKLRGRRIQLQQYPFDALVLQQDELRSVYRDVAEKGCVMIVDELSLFHPDIFAAVQRSPMVTAGHTAIVTVSPFEHYALPPHKVIRQELKDRLAGAFDRFALDFDPQCELSVGDDCRLRRWLYQSLPETVETLRNPRPNRSRMAAFAEQENLDSTTTFAGALYSQDTGLGL